MKLSVIIPTFNAEITLPFLLDSLANQTHSNFEVIFVDDNSSDNSIQMIKSSPHKVIQMPFNQGPAYCRNVGAEKAQGEILIFTDSDCRVHERWLENINRYFFKNDADAIMGKLVLMPSTFLGDSISALGFPAGGAIGFDKIWKVDQDGFTKSLSTCNCALREDLFQRVGGFDTSFPFPGGEDSLLAYNLVNCGRKIKYCPDVIVYHEARDSILDFIKWQFKRGISSYIFSRKIPNKGDFLSLRLWSTKNIVKHYYNNIKFPLILFLLGTSFFVQIAGYSYARYNRIYE